MKGPNGCGPWPEQSAITGSLGVATPRHSFRKDHDMPRRRYVKRNHTAATVTENALFGSILGGKVEKYSDQPVRMRANGGLADVVQSSKSSVWMSKPPFETYSDIQTWSPTHYQVVGGAITFLVRRKSPATFDRRDGDDDPFCCYTWVNNHILVKEDTRKRLHFTPARHLSVLEPRAINEKNFSEWSARARVLDLDWDTPIRLTNDVKRGIDVNRWKNGSPLFIDEFHEDQAPRCTSKSLRQCLGAAVHVYMDACNTGLCALHPATYQFLRVKFDPPSSL
ncbi:hypothetical protein PHMEG_0004247 [Phytophthora megakarya]|uniref:Uncharacterized protein n=1 Tax=Phytophthora megakarya TaxID=4795 RepID=A0A225WU65_9STRA|nr:hypothetical protein PHMEG_0004247 [Phytophthora megakarya]